MKKIKILIITFIVLALIPLFINFFIVFSNEENIYSDKEVEKNYDIALVLGCSVLNENTPSKMLKDRLDMSINLYNAGKVKKILISGDHNKNYSEVDVMYNYLVNNGLDETNILVDYEGYSTSESLMNYKKKYSDESVIIVTQKYHLYRALYIAYDLDLNAIGVHAKLINYHGQIYREIREILARNKDYFVFTFLK